MRWAFFETVADAGLVDLARRDWQEERPTREALAYQVDHVLASPEVADVLRLVDQEPRFDGISDHAALLYEKARPSPSRG